MNVFKNYSAYYNLLYKDKDYKSEAAYIDELIRKHGTPASSMLSLGCGTGKHDVEFAKLGYEVTGVDLSQEMIDVANRNNPDPSRLTFMQGDIRTIRLDKKFDVIVSLFHVMSYQVTNDDLEAAFETAYAHLKEGGLFIFDCWYGPGVLTDLPTNRRKEMQDDQIEVLRTATPVMYYDQNMVEVNYEITVKEKATGNTETINEAHHVRYLFLPELEIFSRNFKTVNHYAWMTEQRPSSEWYIIAIYKK